MATPRRAFSKQRVNLKKEASYGVLEAVINQRLNGLRMVPRKAGETDLFMPSGAALPTVGTRIDDFSEVSVTGRMTFQDIIYVLGSLFGEPTTTTPGGATNARQHVFSWDGFEIVNPVSYSMVYGDVNGAVAVPGVIFNGMGFTAGRENVTELTANGFGKGLVTGQVIYPRQASYTLTISNATGGDYTLTWAGQTTANIAHNALAATILSALEALSNVAPGDVTVSGTGPWVIAATSTGAFAGTAVTATIDDTGLTGGGTEAGTLVALQAGGPVVSIPATPISPLQFDVWADSTWAGLGGTQLLYCYEFETGVGERHSRTRPLKSDQSSDGIVETEGQTHTVRMQLGYDATAEGFFDELDNGDFLFLRLKASGAADSIESGQDYLYQQDTAILLTEVGEPQSVQGGVKAIDISGQLASDPTSGNAVNIVVVNELTGIV